MFHPPKDAAEPNIIPYERPFLYVKQESIFFNEARYVFCEAGTKCGKTHGCIVWLVEEAILNGFKGWNGWWIAPTVSQAKIAFRRIKNATPSGFYRANESEKYIEFPNGAIIWFKSAEVPDNLYGEDVYAAVLDEASRARHDSYLAIRSTLTATRGKLRMIGNVKGNANWFYIMCRAIQRKQATADALGQTINAKYFKLTAYDAVDAGVLDIEEIEDAKKTTTEKDFLELYMADAQDDEEAFIQSSYVQEAMKREVVGYGPLIVGADPSQGKNDPAAFAFRQGFRIHGVEEYKEMDEPAFMGYIIRLIEQGWNGKKVDRINVDATGFGATIVKLLHEKGDNYQQKVKGFHMQQRSLYPQEYGNKRAECWGEMKKAITSQQDLFDLVDDDGLSVELTCIRKKTDSAGRLLLEDKDDLKGRGYDSPNKADATAYTFAEPLSFYTDKKIEYPSGRRKMVMT